MKIGALYPSPEGKGFTANRVIAGQTGRQRAQPITLGAKI